ncbi:MAG: hypothetical protein WCA28_03400 [Bradyrhizobium sp.]
MTALISIPHLVLILSLLVSLAARAGVPRSPCLAARVLLLLASVENSAALADWMIGTAVAWLPIRERIAHCRAMLSQPAAPRRP